METGLILDLAARWPSGYPAEWLAGLGGALAAPAALAALPFLAWSAWSDWRTGYVAPRALALGASLALLCLIRADPWNALVSLGHAGLAYALVFLVNFLHILATGRHGVGMGDAKWTGLCVLAFGPALGGASWLTGTLVAGAVVGAAQAWKLVSCKLAAGKPAAHRKPENEGSFEIRFAPFLLAGLLIGLAEPATIVIGG